MMNEKGHTVFRYFLHACWVSEFTSLPELNANANAVAIESMKIELKVGNEILDTKEPNEKLMRYRPPAIRRGVTLEESRHSNRSFDPVRTVQLPKALQAAYAIDGLTFRPFGIAENDLEVDFSQPSLPALVTDILECCATAGNGKCLDSNLLGSCRRAHASSGFCGSSI